MTQTETVARRCCGSYLKRTDVIAAISIAFTCLRQPYPREYNGFKEEMRTALRTRRKSPIPMQFGALTTCFTIDPSSGNQCSIRHARAAVRVGLADVVESIAIAIGCRCGDDSIYPNLFCQTACVRTGGLAAACLSTTCHVRYFLLHIRYM